MAAPKGGRFRELVRKYGKVALGVHFSISAASITGLYVAIRNNVDVESILEKFHMGAVSDQDNKNPSPPAPAEDPNVSFVFDENPTSSLPVQDKKTSNRTTELAASAGGAFALALLCNKALFPIRVPITVSLTPPIARFLARRKIIKTGT